MEIIKPPRKQKKLEVANEAIDVVREQKNKNDIEKAVSPKGKFISMPIFFNFFGV